MGKNLLNKIHNIQVKHQSFKPDGQNDEIEYDRLAIEVTVDGEITELLFQPTDSQGKLAYTLLRVADDVKNTVAPGVK